MRTFLLYLLLSTAALAEQHTVAPWEVSGLVYGNFGIGAEEGKALLVSNNEYEADDLYLFIDPYYPGEEGFAAKTVYLSDMNGTGVTIAMGEAGLEVHYGTEHPDYGVWTETDIIRFVDGAFVMAGYIFDYTPYADGAEPDAGIRCAYDFASGVVMVTASYSETNIHNFSAGAISLPRDSYAEIDIESMPEAVSALCPI